MMVNVCLPGEAEGRLAVWRIRRLVQSLQSGQVSFQWRRCFWRVKGEKCWYHKSRSNLWWQKQKLFKPGFLFPVVSVTLQNVLALGLFFPAPNHCVRRIKNPHMASVSILNPEICFSPAPRWRRPWRTSAPSTDGRASLRPPRPWRRQPCAPESRCGVWSEWTGWGGWDGGGSMSTEGVLLSHGAVCHPPCGLLPLLNNWFSRQANRS